VYETNFHKVATVTDAAALLTNAEDGMILAGGQTLIPTMKQRLASPTDLIDLSSSTLLRKISVEKRKKMSILRVDGGETVSIGAMVTHAEVAEHAELALVCPVVCSLAGNIGDPSVRHRGTIGGSVANNDPAADYPAALLALEAVIHTNLRKIPASDYFTGMFSTALNDNEIVTSISFQAPDFGGYRKFANPASRYAMVGVFISKSIKGAISVAITGAGKNGVFRHAELETALTADWSTSAIDKVDITSKNLLSDIHADAVYRAHLIKVMAKRALV
jgi:carbon-monoxide dehydrogenase medium subunit